MLSEYRPQKMYTMNWWCVHIHTHMCTYIKRKNAGWQDSLVGRTFAVKPNNLSLIPRNHTLEAEWWLQVVQFAQKCCGTYTLWDTLNSHVKNYYQQILGYTCLSSTYISILQYYWEINQEIKTWGAGERAWQSKVHTALAENLSSIPNSHVRQLTKSCNTSSREPNFICFHWAPVCTHMHTRIWLER